MVQETYGIPPKPKVYIHSYTQLRKTACTFLYSNQFHYPDSLLIIREVSTNSHNMFKDACVRERTPEAYECLFKGCVFKRRPHKTVPQSLEVLKWISPMSDAKFISSIINQSKLPELCNQLLWMPLFAQSPSAESVRYRKIVTPSKPM